jgi:hypothetical protein
MPQDINRSAFTSCSRQRWLLEATNTPEQQYQAVARSVLEVFATSSSTMAEHTRATVVMGTLSKPPQAIMFSSSE